MIEGKTISQFIDAIGESEIRAVMEMPDCSRAELDRLGRSGIEGLNAELMRNWREIHAIRKVVDSAQLLQLEA